MDWKWIVDVFFLVIVTLGSWAFSTLWRKVEDHTRHMNTLEVGMASVQVHIAKDYVHKDDLHRVERQGKSDIEKLESSMNERFDRIDRAIEHLAEKIDGKADKRDQG